jgi:hypothetical protein
LSDFPLTVQKRASWKLSYRWRPVNLSFATLGRILKPVPLSQLPDGDRNTKKCLLWNRCSKRRRPGRFVPIPAISKDQNLLAIARGKETAWIEVFVRLPVVFTIPFTMSRDDGGPKPLFLDVFSFRWRGPLLILSIGRLAKTVGLSTKTYAAGPPGA